MESIYRRESVVTLQAAVPADPALKRLKAGVWLYFLLLIFEGALRKWFLPSLATPLLIIRDPLALWLLLAAWQHGYFWGNGFTLVMSFIAILSIYTAVFYGHGSLYIAAYGARILLLHFPLMFVMGSILCRADILQFAKVTLWLAIPITILIGLQFYSPQSAWVNRGVGGDLGGSGFTGIGDYFRPSATFSFTNGTSLFFNLVAVFVLYYWFSSGNCNRLLLIAATVCLLAAVPLSISRGLFFSVLVSFAFAFVMLVFKPGYLARSIVIGLAVMVSLYILGQTSFFQTASDAFLMRFETANDQEGGIKGVLGDRYLGGLLSALAQSSMMPFWGFGIGMGTNVGSLILSGSRVFLISEGEWGRVVGELGPLLGLAVIFLRVGLCMKLAFSSYQKLLTGDMLPWMLLSFGLLTIPQGGWAQPTSLGFCTVIGGLLLASVKDMNGVAGEEGYQQQVSGPVL